MQNVLSNLHKRRKLMLYIILVLAFAAVVIDSIYQMSPSEYFDEQTRLYMVYFLISYKLIELTSFYFFFYRRHMIKYLLAGEHDEKLMEKFDKNAKRFFTLVPHGSVIFGIISYKLTVNIWFFLLFMLIASMALFLVKPKKFFHYSK